MAEKTSPDLVRGLGPWAATAIVIGTMVGTGIFIVPGAMARDAGSVPVVFLAWLAGGVLSLFGALTYAELGAAMPEAGGEYVYLRRSFGEVPAFLFGWTCSILGRPCSCATIAAGLLRFVSFLVPAVAVPLFTWQMALPFQAEPYTFAFAPAQLLCVLVLLSVTLVNYLGVRVGGHVQVVLTVIKVAVVAAVIAIGFALGEQGGASAAAAAPVLRTASFSGFFVALVAALWAYDGWGHLASVGSEIAHPQRNIPRSLLWGVGLVILLYVLVNAVCFYVLPFETVANSQTVVSDMIALVAGVQSAHWLTIAMILCALGALNSTILTGARVPYAMARDGLFFSAARTIDRRFHTPGGALIFQGILASALALTGTFEELYSLYIFAQSIFFILATASVFALRRREPLLHRPYRTWGYPVVPALFLVGTSILTLNLLWTRPVRSGIGLAFIVLGLPFYRHWRRTAARAGRTSPRTPAEV